MGHCRDCERWKHHQDEYGVAWMSCDGVDYADRGEAIGHDAAAVYVEASDDTGLSGGLITGPDFGCTHFVPKAGVAVAQNLSGNVVIAGDVIVAGISMEDAQETGELANAFVIQFADMESLRAALRARTVTFTVFGVPPPAAIA
ncbi:hypothetical protein E4T66_18615 [Sinimarinibacterium sp. CAU 1509]|uniref:hypothetical protein n=1 Tax=Sinimarinibacterium sp. CAU 1509 TaxID=2562283 RepID=UPI0010AB5576|nr:hypothetical protein [Sinimarinibacterium sp. CAU 1509]TJY57421.1 hypothetical protein E4T66_18615 [Sinimarinibacterium sp. CAU 1509]